MTNGLETRKEYTLGELELEDLLERPDAQLKLWLEVAAQSGVIEPNAMTLSSVAANGRPSSRVVLLRGLDEQGLTFYTNYQSRKGQELQATGFGCLNFWWGALERQVRVEGTVQQVSDSESDAYFASRPYESQLASAASPQSQMVTRKELEQKVSNLRLEFPDVVTRPAHWGGFKLVPNAFEFWQGRKARLHDRIRYELKGDAWVTMRLAP
jgi:pyridoxamine 5'-phosphate oxidase